MVAFKNFLGGTMYVDESRVDEYIALGYSVEETHTKSEEIVAEPKEIEETIKPKKVTKKKK